MTIPAQLRAELGLRPGSRVVAYTENGRLVLEDRDHLLARIQDEVARTDVGRGSAVKALLVERRTEAKREQAEEDCTS